MITVVAVDAPSAGKGLARVTRKTKLAVPPCSWVMEGRSIGSLRELLDDSVGDCLFLGLAERRHVASLSACSSASLGEDWEILGATCS